LFNLFNQGTLVFNRAGL